MTRGLDESRVGVEQSRELSEVLAQRPAGTASERKRKRWPRFLVWVVATFVAATACWLASAGWPPEPAAHEGGPRAERVRAIASEFSEIERLIPRAGGMKREADSRQPAALGVPLDGAHWISSGMGWRKDPRVGALRFHPGLDLAAPLGTPVVAAAAGSVVWAGRYPKEKSRAWWNHGKLVVLRHGDTMTLYAHLDEVRVLRGTWVARGEALGSVGTTGVTTGPHLHFEIRQLGEAGVYMPVDPREAALR